MSAVTRRRTKRIVVALGDEDRADLEAIARKGRISLNEAMRQAIRSVASKPAPPPAKRPEPEPTEDAGSSLEIAVHSLVAVQQLIILMETLLPEGPGAANRVLGQAAAAVQQRLKGIPDDTQGPKGEEDDGDD
jgi:hypothetical protein